jgi:ABC-type multidrug transport system ATPase subunit
MSQAILQITGCTISIAGKTIVTNFNLRLAGQRMVIVGDATPVLAPLFGFGSVEAGSYMVMNSPLEQNRHVLGLAPLDPPMPTNWTPTDYVLWSARLAGATPLEAAALTSRICSILNMGEFQNRPLQQLGTLHRRLTMLAHAAVTSPPLIVIESPLAGMEAEPARHIIYSLGKLTEQGSHLLVTTARFEPDSPADILARGAEDVALIENGEVVEQGSPSELISAEPAASSEDIAGDKPSPEPISNPETPFQIEQPSPSINELPNQDTHPEDRSSETPPT